MEQIAFYLPAVIALVSAFFVIAARSPVHSVLWLICAFVSAAALMIPLGAELMALLLVVVYVGAVAVLFLFVMMMLDVNFSALKKDMWHFAPLGGLVAILLFVEIAVLGANLDAPETSLELSAPTNAESISEVIFTDHFLAFQLAGLILLIAQLGAIVLTLRRTRQGVRRQDVDAQVSRRREDSFESVDVEPGSGV